MALHTQHEWEQIEKREAWSARLADKTRLCIRNTFAKLQYLKSRYRDNIQVFTEIVLDMTPVKVLAGLREFKNIVKVLCQDAQAWRMIPQNERALIVHAAKLAGIMVLVPAWVLLT